MLDDALQYAELLSLWVFPVAPDCHTPIRAEGWFEHGVHDATNDPAEIRKRWAAHPKANIAVACGASGVVGLDVDVKTDKAGLASLEAMQARFGALPRSWRSATPSGGQHLWFRAPAERELRNRVNSLAFVRPDGAVVEKYPGLDVRASYGSLAMPPSIRADGAYRWLDDPADLELAPAPDWLLHIIDPPQPPPKPMPKVGWRKGDQLGMERAARYVERAVESECGDLARMGRGSGRNQKLFQASANLFGLVAGGLLPEGVAQAALERAAVECGLWKEDGPHACRETIKSGERRGQANPRELRS